MKLNKVLALALSGVMAVSMLAGCSGAPVNGEQEGEQGEVVVDANDISDGVASYIDDLPEYVTFNGDNNLTKALDYVVEFVTWEGIPANKLNAIEGDLQNRLVKTVGATKDVSIYNIGDDDVLLLLRQQESKPHPVAVHHWRGGCRGRRGSPHTIQQQP